MSPPSGRGGGRVSAAGGDGHGGRSLGLGGDDDVAVALHPRQLVALEVHHQLAQSRLARHEIQPDLGLRLWFHRLLAGGRQGVGGAAPLPPSAQDPGQQGPPQWHGRAPPSPARRGAEMLRAPAPHRDQHDPSSRCAHSGARPQGCPPWGAPGTKISPCPAPNGRVKGEKALTVPWSAAHW